MNKIVLILIVAVVIGFIAVITVHQRIIKTQAADLGMENAILAERWIVSRARDAVEKHIPEPYWGISPSGGESRSGHFYEVLKAKDIYWKQDVGIGVLNQIVDELESVPEFQEWLNDAEEFGQQRRIGFKVKPRDENPFLRILFLCNNLPGGETVGEGFMENMWQQ